MRRMRERKAAGLLPDDGPVLRDAARTLGTAVETSLEALGLGEQDAAAAALARRYAEVLDTARDPAWAARWLGPELLRVLDALKATPAARQKDSKPGKTEPSRLDQLRSVRARSAARDLL
jgi:hypothetical protein